jgi:hypothetical protein
MQNMTDAPNGKSGKDRSGASANLPARIERQSALAPAALPDLEKLQKEYGALARHLQSERIAGGMVGDTISTIALTTGLVAGGPFGLLVALPFALIFKTATLASAAVTDDKTEKARTEKREKLQKQFLAAQKKAFADKQAQLIALADETLARGELLGEKELSYLAALDPALLKDASDQLAITVLQARGMIAYMRAEEKRIRPPLTFRTAAFDPRNGLHRAYLRDKLAEAKTVLAEDDYPNGLYQELEFPRDGLRPDSKGYLLRLAVPFYSFWKDAKKAVDAPLLENGLPEISVPPLKPAGDFSALLSAFERAAEPLDLPAMRGWNRTGAPSALPAPRNPVVPRHSPEI